MLFVPAAEVARLPNAMESDELRRDQRDTSFTGQGVDAGHRFV